MTAAAQDFASRRQRDLRRVLNYADRWGVRVELYQRYGGARSHKTLATHDGPAHGGIHWPTRTVLFPSDGDPHALLHEVNHVVVDVDPDEVDEVTGPMLALDYHGSRLLRLADWRGWMDGFVVPSMPNEFGHHARDWPTCTTRERGAFLAGSRAKAVEAGLLTDDGRPTFERRGAVST